MVPARDGPGLALEPLLACRVRRELRQNLDRDSASKPGVASTVDLTHSTRAERRRDFIKPGAAGQIQSIQ